MRRAGPATPDSPSPSRAFERRARISRLACCLVGFSSAFGCLVGCAKVDTGAAVNTDAGSTGDGTAPWDASAVVDIAIRGEVGSVISVDGGDLGLNCTRALRAVIRDFKGVMTNAMDVKHPDFDVPVVSELGIVGPMIGSDQKPVYAAPATSMLMHGPDLFAQWYRDVPDVNMKFEIDLALTPHATKAGTFVYDNDMFFPIDTMGFGNQYQAHNYHFTSELHFKFPYRGGEEFTFRGDDDLWLFVNGHLAIDLGGVHIAQTGTVRLDEKAAAFGIVPNNTYQMDIFHAERHPSDSTFHIETTLQCIDNVVIP